ncbi:MAG: hypothetical protein KDJ23_17425 [Rhodoblastus sp.]|nr:hypothetical protein [Rhodoblastus sp.]MCB1525883.1 hypothetical protein [Rhodoblastus sp.]HPG03596.1 hypothetical protein [Rhodoblastus sp.]
MFGRYAGLSSGQMPPAPDAPFYLILRLYQPMSDFQQYKLPVVERVDRT